MATQTERTLPSNRRRPAARLKQYHAKRQLEASGEPAEGTLSGSAGSIRRFVIQQHDATNLHYDFRLEMDGVYRSWAVPKGLPTTPGQRALAVEVEDHPLEYGNFEGIIPKGNYGAGTVMLWDRGHYTVSGVSPERAYREGKIHLALAGAKSVGEWTLVRMHPRPGDRHANWLLIRNSAPEHAARMTGGARELSVLSGRSLEQIASGEPAAAERRKVRTSTASTATPRSRQRSARNASEPGNAPARRVTGPARTRAGAATRGKGRAPVRGVRSSSERLAPAKFIPPMKALSVDVVPEGKWRLEIKLDGYRALAVINGGKVELWSRNHKPLTDHYPAVVQALEGMPCRNAVIDGEIVALDEQGRSRFQLLQNSDGATHPIVYYMFDLLHHDGRSLLAVPIEERQMTLSVLAGKDPGPLRVSPVFEVSPEALLSEVRRQQLEGIIAKTPGSAYEPDRRSGTWLKCKVHGEQEFVIGGFTPPRNSRPHFGAILVGYHQGGRLLYAGKVGSGFNHESLASLHREFMRRRIDECPFADLPSDRRSRYGTGMNASVMRQVTWIKPELVAQVQFTEWTSDGSLRHPVFLGLRKEKKARDVVRETGAPLRGKGVA